MILAEVSKFEAMDGFLNIFLQNEQFMDRVQFMLKKRQVSYLEASHETSPFESSFMIRPIGQIESVFRQKFGTPRQSKLPVCLPLS